MMLQAEWADTPLARFFGLTVEKKTWSVEIKCGTRSASGARCCHCRMISWLRSDGICDACHDRNMRRDNDGCVVCGVFVPRTKLKTIRDEVWTRDIPACWMCLKNLFHTDLPVRMEGHGGIDMKNVKCCNKCGGGMTLYAGNGSSYILKIDPIPVVRFKLMDDSWAKWINFNTSLCKDVIGIISEYFAEEWTEYCCSNKCALS